MDFRLLGPLEVVDERGPVDVGSHRQRALLALLALHPNRVVTTERILDALWGEDAMDKENAMWVAISRLRSALEPDHKPGNGSLVVTRDHGYELAIDPERIDVTHFEADISAARALADHDAQAALTKVDEALVLWRGTPVEEFAYEEFARFEIARLEDLHLVALELRAEVQLRLGGGREQLATLEALHEQHPLRERFVELFMRSLYQAGRQADALRVFDTHRRALGEELGLGVSPELARLEEQILLHDPAVRVLRRTDAVATPATVTNPFKGLRAFTEDDVEDFFGRDRLVSDIVRHLGDDQTLLALVGASGSGKSSAVGAGVIPALRKGALPGSESWLIAKMLPGSHPMAALEAALLRSTIDAPDSLAEQLGEPGTGLLRAALRILPEGACLVLVIEQFEELFTLVVDEAERSRFLDLLGPALDDPHKRVRVVLTLRADFYEHPLAYPAFAQRLSAGVMNVTALAPEEFEAAAMKPMLRAGVGVEPALLASLLTDVVGQPGALPLFQYTLTTLFDRREGDVLSLEDYREIGGLRGAITERADELMEQLSEAEQDIAHQLFLRLVTIGEDGDWSRRRVAASELISLPLDLVALQHVIESFNSQRLLASDRDHLTGSPTIEVAHEALISQWPRFKAWIDEDVQGLQLLTHLRDVSHAWEVGGEDVGDLYRGARLEVVLDWVDAARPVLSDLESRFLTEARDVHESELEAERRSLELSQRQNRRLRRMLALVGTTAILAAVLGVAALQQRQRADESTRQAVSARTVAETGRLAAEAPALASSNRQVALLMAAEAYRRDPGANTLGALQRVLTGTGNLIGHLGQTGYDRAVWSPDGRFIMGLRVGGVDVFDVGTAVRVRSIDTQTGGVMDVSPSGDLLAVSTSTELQLFDLTNGEPSGPPFDHQSAIQAIRFSTDGKTLATGDRRGVLRVFNVTDQRDPLEIDAHLETDFDEVDVPEDVAVTATHEPDSLPFGVRQIVFTKDDSEIATTGGLFIRTWRTTDGVRLTNTQVTRPSTLAPGRLVGRPAELFMPTEGEAIVRANRFIQRWDLTTGDRISEYALDVADASGVVSSLGTLGVSFIEGRVAVAELDTVSILDISDGTDLSAPVDIQAGSTTANIQFAPDGRTVAVAGATGIVLWAADGRELLATAVPKGTRRTGGLQVSSDGRLLVVGANEDDGGAVVWLVDGDQPRKLDLPNPRTNRLWLDLPDHFITQDLTGLLEVVQIGSLETVGVDFGRINNFTLAASPNGDLVAVVAGVPDDPLIHIFDPRTGQPVTAPIDLRTLDPSVESPFGLAFNADGTRLLASTRKGAAAAFDTSTWEMIGAPISQGGGLVLDVVYSSDGRFLATSDSTGSVTLRDPMTHQPLGPQLVGSTAGVTTAGFHPLVFSPDGRYLVATADGSARLWDIEAAVLIGSPIAQDERSSTSASPNARWLPLNRQDHILIYDLDVARWFDVACRAAGRNFTAAEWQQFGPADAGPQQTCPQWAPPDEADGG